MLFYLLGVVGLLLVSWFCVWVSEKTFSSAYNKLTNQDKDSKKVFWGIIDGIICLFWTINITGPVVVATLAFIFLVPFM